MFFHQFTMCVSFVTTVLIFLSLTASGSDVFIGYNCQNPEDTKFISHEQCHKQQGTTETKQFNILQKKTVSEIKGYACEGFKTVEVSYCGAYR